MASQSYRNTIAALSLCESCAVSVLNHNGKEPDATRLPAKVADELKKAAQEALRQWPVQLTQKEADKITGGMR